MTHTKTKSASKEKLRNNKKFSSTQHQIQQMYEFGHIYQPDEYPAIKVIKRNKKQRKASQAMINSDPSQ